jgi:hypothetical protein
MHVSKDSMWQEIWKILQNFLETKQGPTGLNNVAKTYQDSLRGMTGRIQKLQLTGAQEGLMWTVTPEDCLVH